MKDTKTKIYNVPIVFQIGDKNHAGYPANSTTLVTASIIKLLCFDAKESGGGNYRNQYGNNRYSLSNLRQWLNKAGTGWYASQHTYDQPPSSGNVNSGWNPYDAQPGFLSNFGAEMLAALMDTTLTVAKPTCDGGGSETVTDKVFPLSSAEVGLGAENGISEGSMLALFRSDNSSRVRNPTAEAVSNSTYTDNSLNASSAWYYWLRSPNSGSGSSARRVSTDGSLDSDVAWDGYNGLVVALNLSSDILVSDTAGSDGCYTIIWNNAPTTPPSITVPDEARSGKGLPVSWAASVDPEGDAVSYELERQYNSGAWAKVYDGAATTYTDTITEAMNTVAYRVRAKDAKDAYSGYTTGPTRTVVHNADPTVSGSDQNLGVITQPPSYTYTVDDPDVGDELTIVESLDGQELRTIEDAERNHQYTCALTPAQFSTLTGQHVLSIRVLDSAGNSSVRNITFTRTVARISFEWKMDDTTQAAEKVLISLRYLASDDDVTMEVCNNYNDAAPTWEQAKSGLKHIFSNNAKTAASWAVGVRVQINKSAGYDEVACYSLSGSYI